MESIAETIIMILAAIIGAAAVLCMIGAIVKQIWLAIRDKPWLKRRI